MYHFSNIGDSQGFHKLIEAGHSNAAVMLKVINCSAADMVSVYEFIN